MAVYFDAARLRWRFDFSYRRQRHAGYCLDEHGTPVTTKRAAREIERLERAKAIKAGGAKPAPAPGAYTLAHAIAAHLPLTYRRKDGDAVRTYLAEIGEYFGLATPIAAIDDARIRSYQTWCLGQPRRVYVGGPRARANLGARKAIKGIDATRAVATTNHYVKALLRVLRQAHTTRDPATGLPLLAFMPNVVMLKEPEHKPRPISGRNLDRIKARAEKLGAGHEHVRDLVELNYHFGLRLREGTYLRADQVDFDARGIWLDAGGTKGKRGEFVPGNSAGMALLRRLVKRAREARQERLILYRRSPKSKLRPIDNPRRAFRRILADLELAGVHRLHNIKASFVTEIARRAPAAVVQRAARHKDFRTTQRYLEVVDADLRAAIEGLAPARSRNAPKPHTKAPHGRRRAAAEAA